MRCGGGRKALRQALWMPTVTATRFTLRCAPPLPVRQLRLVLMRPMHDPVLDPSRAQPLPALFRLIRLVRIDRLLVPHDQRVRNVRIRHVRRRQLNSANQPRALVHADVQFVAEMRLLPLPRPRRVGVRLAPRSRLRLRAPRLRLNHRRVDQRAPSSPAAPSPPTAGSPPRTTAAQAPAPQPPSESG